MPSKIYPMQITFWMKVSSGNSGARQKQSVNMYNEIAPGKFSSYFFRVKMIMIKIAMAKQTFMTPSLKC